MRGVGVSLRNIKEKICPKLFEKINKTRGERLSDDLNKIKSGKITSDNSLEESIKWDKQPVSFFSGVDQPFFGQLNSAFPQKRMIYVLIWSLVIMSITTTLFMSVHLLDKRGVEDEEVTEKDLILEAENNIGVVRIECVWVWGDCVAAGWACESCVGLWVHSSSKKYISSWMLNANFFLQVCMLF